MNSFLLDKIYSEKYEKYFADKLGVDWAPSTKDDHGVDIVYPVGLDNHYIDVKCFAAPKFIPSFKGVYLETLQLKSGKPGWYKDNSKLTTDYIFVINAKRESIDYSVSYYISRRALREAVLHAFQNEDIDIKEMETTQGFILPYEYLEEWGVEL